MKRTRFVYGCQNSPDFVCPASRELLEHVIAMSPINASRKPDKVIFTLPPTSTTAPLSEIVQVAVESRPIQVSVTEVIKRETKEINCPHPFTGIDSFCRVSVHYEQYTTNQSLMKENSSFYRVDSYTDNMQYETLVDGRRIVYESGIVWSAPIFDVDNPLRLFFPKNRGYLTGIIEGEFVDIDSIRQTLKFTLPGLFLPPQRSEEDLRALRNKN